MDPQHPDIAETLYDLAQLREMQQQLTEALSFYQQALPIREQALGVCHPKTCETRERLQAVLNVLGDTGSGSNELVGVICLLLEVINPKMLRLFKSQGVNFTRANWGEPLFI